MILRVGSRTITLIEILVAVMLVVTLARVVYHVYFWRDVVDAFVALTPFQWGMLAITAPPLLYL